MILKDIDLWLVTLKNQGELDVKKIGFINSLKRNRNLILIFLISLIIQIALLIVFQVFSWVSQHSSNNSWFIFLMNTLEPYADYKYWYQGFAKQFFYENWLPYFNLPTNPNKYRNLLLYIVDIILGNQNLSFIYPPFFFYSIIIPASININFVFFPLLLANLLLPIVVYKILDKNKKKKVAEWGFITSALSPLLIFYNGGLLLNTSYVTLFFVIALYFVSKKRFIWSIVFLSVACLFKQTTVFFFLPFLIYIVLVSTERESNHIHFIYFKKLLKYSGILIGILFLGSLPWIILEPSNYLESLMADQSLTFIPQFILPEYNFPVKWYSFLIQFGAPYWLIYILGFLTFTFIGIVLIEIIAMFMLFKWKRNGSLTWLNFLDLIVYTAFMSHLFFPRGVYKYYFTFHVPLVILWFCFHFKEKLMDNDFLRKSGLLLFISVSFIILIFPRMYYLILIWILFFIIVKKSQNKERKNNNLNL